MARHGVALRFGRFVAVLLICAALGAALGHAIVGRGTRPDEEDDAATEESRITGQALSGPPQESGPD